MWRSRVRMKQLGFTAPLSELDAYTGDMLILVQAVAQRLLEEKHRKK